MIIDNNKFYKGQEIFNIGQYFFRFFMKQASHHHCTVRATLIKSWKNCNLKKLKSLRVQTSLFCSIHCIILHVLPRFNSKNPLYQHTPWPTPELTNLTNLRQHISLFLNLYFTNKNFKVVLLFWPEVKLHRYFKYNFTSRSDIWQQKKTY